MFRCPKLVCPRKRSGSQLVCPQWKAKGVCPQRIVQRGETVQRGVCPQKIVWLASGHDRSSTESHSVAPRLRIFPTSLCVRINDNVGGMAIVPPKRSATPFYE